MLFDEGEYYSPSEVFSCLNSGVNSIKKKMMNKKRFSDEQVKSLESIFENETKLEPKKKLQLAKELGLQPRQVAIWFQNKRARYKSRQLERDYTLLRANYDALAAQFDSLKKEKQSLTTQLQKLKAEAAEGADHRQNSGDEASADESKSEKGKEESEEKGAVSVDGSEHGGTSISMVSDEGSSANNHHYLGEVDDMDMLAAIVQAEPPVTVAAPAEGWDVLRPDGLFDHGGDSSQWWDFWS